jgi:hypothetical protein
MVKVLYFGDRFSEFKKAVNIDVTKTSVLPNGSFDITVIDGNVPMNAKVPIGTIGVVNSENTSGLACFMRSGIRTVTCGLSRRDTVTVSSSVGNIVVCLQRRLPVIGGNILEPAEFTAAPPLSETDDCELLLLAAAVRLLCFGGLQNTF